MEEGTSTCSFSAGVRWVQSRGDGEWRRREREAMMVEVRGRGTGGCRIWCFRTRDLLACGVVGGRGRGEEGKGDCR